uniref:Ig-like domain-containing protein n=1 Tax=Acanthochromis polyacanthus TaxID=80966 RepID=A0A3Q1EX83_9TELE
MMNFTFRAALLCTFSFFSVSGFLTVEAQPGEEVTLMCNNFTISPSNVFWYRLTSGANFSCVSSMSSSATNVLLCEGFHKDKFDMTSNITNLSLNIKTVDVSDSGLYFCGCCKEGFSALVSPTYLKVQEKSDENTNLMVVILGGLTLFLVMLVIGLMVKIRKLQKGTFENLLDLSYFMTFAKRGGRREMEPTVVYAATR